jgi:hypothetical protein
VFQSLVIRPTSSANPSPLSPNARLGSTAPGRQRIAHLIRVRGIQIAAPLNYQSVRSRMAVSCGWGMAGILGPLAKKHHAGAGVAVRVSIARHEVRTNPSRKPRSLLVVGPLVGLGHSLRDSRGRSLGYIDSVLGGPVC